MLDWDNDYNSNNSIAYPLKLNEHEKALMHKLTKKIHQSLQNCFEGTTKDKVQAKEDDEKSPIRLKDKDLENKYLKVFQDLGV